MILFANILLAIIAILDPQDGSTVPTLRKSLKTYLAVSRASRHKAMNSTQLRNALAARDGAQTPVRLAWSGDTNGVYDVTVQCEGCAEEKFTVSGRTETWLINLNVGAKYNWTVVNAENDESASGNFTTESATPRLLWAEGVLNMRDIGGWRGLDDRRVKQNMIIRSAGLRDNSKSRGGGILGGGIRRGENRITAAGIETMRKDFKIRTEIELRAKTEVIGFHESILGPDVRWINQPFVAYDFIDNPVRGREPFAQIFKILLEPKNYPILIHCSGGRDRTGTLFFLLEGLLGIGDEDLLRDWEATIFVERDLAFKPTRINRLVKYLAEYGGKTYAENCEQFALGCGITRAEIAKFREIMLEDNH